MSKHDKAKTFPIIAHDSTSEKIAVLMMAIAFTALPEQSHAAGMAGFSTVTAFFKEFLNMFIFEWGYYLGIITLAFQGYRWKTGRIDLAQLGVWTLGVVLVFFAPNIVSEIRSSSAGSV